MDLNQRNEIRLKKAIHRHLCEEIAAAKENPVENSKPDILWRLSKALIKSEQMRANSLLGNAILSVLVLCFIVNDSEQWKFSKITLVSVFTIIACVTFAKGTQLLFRAK